jgi:hypothetical protein
MIFQIFSDTQSIEISTFQKRNKKFFKKISTRLFRVLTKGHNIGVSDKGLRKELLKRSRR